MAVQRQVIITRSSDLSGESAEGVRGVAFTLDGRKGKLDLTPGEVATFEGIMAPYFEAAQNASAGNTATDSNGDDENAQIRQWGRDHGWDVQERGKLSVALKSAYYAHLANAGDETPMDVKADDSEKPAPKAKNGK